MGRIINVEEANELNIDYYVYTDGACVHNGYPNAKAGYGIFFGIGDPRNVSTGFEGKQTNNIAELLGVINTFPIIKRDVRNGKIICIVTDSKYVLKCVGSYGSKQEKDDWTKDIPNKTLVQKAYNIYKNLNNVYFMYVKAHTEFTDIHSMGNKYADELAVQGIGSGSGLGSGIGPKSNPNPKPKPVPKTQDGSRVYLSVPYSEKDVVKGLGGRWDAGKKQWYIMMPNPNVKMLVEKYGIK